MVETRLIVIQPTSLCNINCHYCYLPERTVKKRIAPSTIKQIGKTFFCSPFASEEVTIVWHASEPLVLPIRFYEKAFQSLEEQNSQGVKIQHSFQTNATLITQEWCDFIKHQQIQVGVSVDGPQWIHDANRVDRAGNGTFLRAMKGIQLLKKNGIAFSVIAVVSEKSLLCAEEIWRFFLEMQPERLCLNPEESEGIHSRSSLEGEEMSVQYRSFLKKVLALNIQAGEPLKIREFETMLEHIQAGGPLTKSHTNVGGAIFSFDCDGNISTFSPELLTVKHASYDDFHFGNVFTHSLSEILSTPKFLAIERQILRGIDQCLRTCEYFMFCGGGFPSNKLSERASFETTETQACRLRIKIPADILLEHWEEKYSLNFSSPM